MIKNQRAFTLLEILISLIIFATIAVITSAVLYNVYNTHERLKLKAKKLADIQIAISLMQHDFQYSYNRPVTDIKSNLLPAFWGKQYFAELTSSDIINPIVTQKISNFYRIRYLVKNKQLIRRRWQELDRITTENFNDRIILSDISHAQFNFLDNKLNLLSSWNSADRSKLPNAVQVNLTIQHWGKMSLLFLIPQEAIHVSST